MDWFTAENSWLARMLFQRSLAAVYLVAFIVLAGGVEECGNPTTLGGQPLVCRERGVRLLTHDLDASILKQGHRVWRDPEPAFASAAQDQHVGVVIEKLEHVRRKDSRPMVGAGLSPVPSSATAWPQLDVAETAESIDLDVSPAVIEHPRRHRVHAYEGICVPRQPGDGVRNPVVTRSTGGRLRA